MASRLRGEQGQYVPLIGAVMFTLLVGGFLLFQVAAASALRARAQTAADAAALGGVLDVKRQLEAAWVHGLPPTAVNRVTVCAQAARYAAVNEARVVSCTLELYDVKVVVEGTRELGTGAEAAGREDAEGEARARASLGVSYALGVPGAPGSGGATRGGGSNCMTEREIEEVEEAAGVRVVAGSALRRGCGTGNGDGIAVRPLVMAMKVAIARAEDLIGPLQINSAYRTVAYQRELCGRVNGPCAAPGASLHNFGQAIDVQNFGALARVASRVGLCQPLPSNDAVHFSIAAGRECGGRAGGSASGGGGLGGGASFAVYQPKLVRWSGAPDFSMPAMDPIAGASAAEQDLLRRIAICESGGDLRAYNRSSGASGKYQFLPSTWRGIGGAGDPRDASEAVQDAMALRLLRLYGPTQWECYTKGLLR